MSLATILFVLRLALAALLLYTSFSKLNDIDGFAFSVYSYHIIPRRFIHLFSVYIPLLELVLGIMLAFRIAIRPTLIVTTALLSIFSLAILQAIARGINIDCGCFGATPPSKWSLPLALLRNCALLASCLWLLSQQSRGLTATPQRAK